MVGCNFADVLSAYRDECNKSASRETLLDPVMQVRTSQLKEAVENSALLHNMRIDAADNSIGQEEYIQNLIAYLAGINNLCETSPYDSVYKSNQGFTWIPAYDKKQQSVLSLSFEMASILYNLAIYSFEVAGEQSLKTVESVQKAFTEFKKAASFLLTMTNVVKNLNLKLELSEKSAMFLFNLAKAQAMECMLCMIIVKQIDNIATKLSLVPVIHKLYAECMSLKLEPAMKEAQDYVTTKALYYDAYAHYLFTQNKTYPIRSCCYKVIAENLKKLKREELKGFLSEAQQIQHDSTIYCNTSLEQIPASVSIPVNDTSPKIEPYEIPSVCMVPPKSGTNISDFIPTSKWIWGAVAFCLFVFIFF